MPARLNPYLGFRNQSKEAMEFYQTVFGGDLNISYYKDMPGTEAAEADKVMHAQLEGDNDVVFMASDTPEAMPYNPGDNMSMSLSGDDEGLLRGYWERLSPGSSVVMPLEQAPWGDTFGMLKDKFGINWMVNITGQPQG